MSNFKRIAAFAAAAAMAGSLAACGSNTAYAYTINGQRMDAGIYIYYSYVAYSDAINTLSEQDPELDVTDDAVVKEQQIDGKDTVTWIQEKTAKYCKEHAAVNNEFDAAGLTLSDETMGEVEETMDYMWGQNAEKFERN